MTAWAIIERENQILLVKRSAKTSRPGQWCFPGGGVHRQETPEKACVRETREETGLDIQVRYLIANIDNNDYFQCRLIDEQQDVQLKLNECDDFSWLAPLKLLDVGIVMDLKQVYSVLNTLGYQVELNEETQRIIG